MSKKRPRTLTPQFKSKVGPAALKGEATSQDLAARYEVHPNQIPAWRKAVEEGTSAAFGNDDGKEERENQALIDDRYRQIGQLTAEIP